MLAIPRSMCSYSSIVAATFSDLATLVVETIAPASDLVGARMYYKLLSFLPATNVLLYRTRQLRAQPVF